jgi:integrase
MTASEQQLPAVNLIVREQSGQLFYNAKFRYRGKQVWRTIGPAWVSAGAAPGEFRPRRGRPAEGFFDNAAAQFRAAEIVEDYVHAVLHAEQLAEEARNRGVTFREVAHAYMDWLQNVKGAKPSTLRSHWSNLAEPGTPYKRGEGVTAGHIMAALGDRPAAEIEPAEVEALLRHIAETGVAPATVNRNREIINAIFNYGTKPTTFSLPSNPAKHSDRRRIPAAPPLVFYRPEEIEALARAMTAGAHRPANWQRDELDIWEDSRDGEAVRVAAYAGLRLGELLALRWRDIDWTGSALIISRAMSAGIEGSTKTDVARQVPLSDQAAGALDRLSKRPDYTSPSDFIFCNAYGRPLDGSALRRRFKRARDAAGLRPLRWHDLRHTFGSLLVAGGLDLVSVKEAMGHAQLGTTTRYLHARPATETAAKFTSAFASAVATDPLQAESDRT